MDSNLDRATAVERTVGTLETAGIDPPSVAVPPEERPGEDTTVL